MRTRVAIVAAIGFGVAFVGLQWLRYAEPLGLDQSLFAYYGRCMRNGLTLYRDLWDSKPPGIFIAYAIAGAVTGVVHTAWALDAIASIAAALLTARLTRDLGATPAAVATAAVLAAFATGAPVFGGAAVAAQAEPLITPLLLAAALWARKQGAGAALAGGALVGTAALFKFVALIGLPVIWFLAPPLVRRDIRRGLAIAVGLVVPIALAALVLVARGALGDAMTATLVYPRAYAAEIAARMPLTGSIARGALQLVSGAPLLLAWAMLALVTRTVRTAPALVAWLVLAAIAVAAQRQMAGYQLFLLVPPLVLLAGFGAVRWWRMVAAAWYDARRSDVVAGARLMLLAVVVAVPAAHEARQWWRHYTPHAAFRAGHIDREQFLQQLGGPGSRWIEATAIANEIHRADARAAATPNPKLFVWGLAPSVYALADLPPATRFAFHQTLYVDDAPLARRFPDSTQRRADLLATLDRDPPRWVVIVHGDRSGLEPQDSATELQQFPALGQRLEASYRRRSRTAAFELLQRVD